MVGAGNLTGLVTQTNAQGHTAQIARVFTTKAKSGVKGQRRNRQAFQPTRRRRSRRSSDRNARPDRRNQRHRIQTSVAIVTIVLGFGVVDGATSQSNFAQGPVEGTVGVTHGDGAEVARDEHGVISKLTVGDVDRVDTILRGGGVRNRRHAAISSRVDGGPKGQTVIGFTGHGEA